MPSKDPVDEIPHQRAEPRPDFSKPLPRKPLPKSLQSTLDSEEKLWQTLYAEPPYVRYH
jgi:fission process protein 1